MANTFLTPDIIAREALMVLRANAVMPMLVHRDYSQEFNGAVGDTITIRKPAKFNANEFTSAITVQDATEGSVQVKLDKFLDVSFAVTAKQQTLDIKDFSAQLLVPAMQAFLNKVDGYLIALGAGATNRVAVTAPMTKDSLIAVRKGLQANNVPLTERRFVTNVDAEADLLKTDLFLNASAVGDNGTALREASLGRKFGLDIYTDQNVPTNTSLAFHKNAMALVTRTIAPPKGTDKYSIVNYDGFALRVVQGYDITKKTDTISIDMLCGVALLDDDLIVATDETRS